MGQHYTAKHKKTSYTSPTATGLTARRPCDELLEGHDKRKIGPRPTIGLRDVFLTLQRLYGKCHLPALERMGRNNFWKEICIQLINTCSNCTCPRGQHAGMWIALPQYDTPTCTHNSDNNDSNTHHYELNRTLADLTEVEKFSPHHELERRVRQINLLVK